MKIIVLILNVLFLIIIEIKDNDRKKNEHK